MENFIVSARKYRPATFETVVGQKSITSTLKNAIKTSHLAHAYLFCGPRGVGKTTCARIFAKTINCQNLTPELEACDKCESCVSFNGSRSYNIHELDAASNNSVEDIRTLTDQVRIPPQVGKHSVYIIDEVHMLSSAAFNAFLKTLEEPPAHATFILATTEKHKIIPTILSRCQIFDFNRIKVEDIVDHLANVARKENIEADLDGLNVIAQKADGGMRDALSYFDQIVSFSGSKITYKNVIDNLNVLDYDYYFKIVNAFMVSNIAESLLIFNEILDNGFDGHHFITGLSSHFRDLLVCKDNATLELLEVGATIRENYKKQAEKCSVDFLFRALNISNKCDLDYRESRNKRLLVELSILQLCYISQARQTQTQPVEIQQKPTEQKAVVNQPPVKEMPKIPTGISIKDLTNQTNKVEVEKKETIVTEPVTNYVKTEELKNNFTQEDLNVKWAEFVQTIKSTNPRLSGTLSANTPILKTNFLLELTLANQLLQDDVNQLKFNMLSFLRKELKNSKIDIITVIAQQPEKKKVYTEADKYKYLNEINPNLNKLKQQFNLDF